MLRDEFGIAPVNMRLIKLITKGDANNSKDVPINKSQVIGKVKYIIPKAGIWKQVLTEPSVLISLLLFIIIITVITYYKP